MDKILILGSNSCSGSGVISELAKSNQYKILPTSRSQERDHYYLPYKWQKYSSLMNFQCIDINTSLNELNELIDEFKPKFIINFASQSMVSQSWDSPEDWMYTNVFSMIKLIKLINNKKFVKKYIHFSTPEVYGDTGNSWITENYNFKPTTPYALSRSASDNLVQMWHENFGFPSIITRSANVFGPGQQLYRIIPKAIYMILKGEKIPLHGGGKSVRSFIHYSDIAQALDLIIKNGQKGETYHISESESISIYDLIKMITELLSVDFKSSIEITKDRRGKDSYYLLDSAKLSKLGWKSQISLEKGIFECIKWIKKNFKKISSDDLKYIHRK